MSPRALLVEDEKLVGAMVRLNLQKAGYEVVWAEGSSEAWSSLQNFPVDVIVLDIAIPGSDGLQLLRNIRQNGMSTPVLMLTARDEISIKIQAFEWGADDYLSKPFDINELVFRIHALVRRSQAPRELPSTGQIRIGNFTVNLVLRKAESNEGLVSLTEKEVALLQLMIRSPGSVLRRADILEEIWGMDVTITERIVDNFIWRFRKLFEEHPDNPSHFLTIRGEGYCYAP